MNELMIQPTSVPAPRLELSVADVRKRKELVHELMRELMVPGQHYGEIPGTDGKPALLKSGAEMLCMTFRLAATFNVHIDDLPDFPFTNSDPLIVNRVNPVDPRV